MDQWREVAAIVSARGLIPFVDLAYQGLGKGLEADAAGTRLVVEAAEQAIVAQSCDKNFGCYRDRLGTLFVKGSSARARRASPSAICSASRGPCGRCRPTIWRRWRGSSSTMPELRADWRAELDEMCGRIRQLRARLAVYDPRLAFIEGQNGHVLDAAADPGRRCSSCAREKGIYMAGSRPVQRRRPLRRQRRALRRRGGGEDGWLRPRRSRISARKARRGPRRPTRRSTGARSPISSTSAGRWTARGGPGSSPSARSSTSSARAATTWPRSCSAAGSTIRRDGACGYYRSRPMLLALGVPLGRRAGLEHGPRRRLFGRARHRRRLQLSQSRRLPGAADVRRRRRAIYADRGLGAGDRISPQGARRRQL